MSKRIVDYDPVSGISLYSDYDPVTDITTVIHEFDDLEDRLEYSKRLQNDNDYTKQGIKTGWWHYAHTPNALIHKWLVEDGINPYRKQDLGRWVEKINSREYRHLKMTTKLHTVKG